MMKTLIGTLLLALSATAHAWDNGFEGQDAYGPGTHADQTGRAFEFRSNNNDRSYGDVELNGYGHGVHRDQYGRPVQAVPQNGHGGLLLPGY